MHWFWHIMDSWDPSQAGRLQGQAGFTPASGLSASACPAGMGGSSQQRGELGWGWRLQVEWDSPSSPVRGL